MEENFDTSFQGEENAKNFTFVIPSTENENSGHTEVITFSHPPDNGLPDVHDSSLEPPYPTQPPDPQKRSP